MLHDAGTRHRLLAELRGVDRLVLLGDVVELRQGPVRDALAASRATFEAFGAALGSDGEVVIVPGNHDHHLTARWLERRASKHEPPALGLESAIDWRAGEPLATIARWLRPAQVRAAYPGVWLRDDVYATHGHYIDRHTTVPMFERLAAGAMARIVGEDADYEAILGPIYSWIHAVAQTGGPRIGASSHGAWRRLSRSRRGLAAGFPVAIAALNRAGLGPLKSNLSGHELRRAALRAFGEVLSRLGVETSYVIFGHTHRAGPLAADAPLEWRAPAGSRLMNTGSWVHERYFLGPDPASSPYRPGFSVLLEDDRPPELRCLLD